MMKRGLLLWMLLFSTLVDSQITITNDGVTLTVEAGVTATIGGSYVNQTNGANLGIIDNAGTISLTHDWTNNSVNTVFSTNTGLTSFVGTLNAQSILGSNSTEFYNLTINNTFATFPQIAVSENFSAKNTLTMTQGSIDLNSNTATVGRSAANPGSIVHGEVTGSGFFFDGNLTRYFATATIADLNISGFFPLGTPAATMTPGVYRPMYLSLGTVPATGGTVTVFHTQNANDTAAVTIADDVNIESRHNSTWTVASAGMTGGGSDYNMYIGGDALGTIGDINHLRVMLNAAKADGTPGGNAAAPVNLAKRSGLTLAQLANTFHIGTIDSNNSPLPIELLAFRAFLNSSGFVDIDWTTAAEINNEEFVVEKSKDGVGFEYVHSQNGAGNSTEEINYSAIDYEPYVGVSYYRLKQVDYDGSYTYTHLELINNGNNETAVYPVPAYNTDIQVKLETATEGSATMEIFDQHGALIYRESGFEMEEGVGLKTISAQVFETSGVYYLSFICGATQIRKKIIFYK